MVMDANKFTTYESGATIARVPQSAIWDQYADMFEYYLTEWICLEFFPTFMEVETTSTGT
jgi:hypothetical protein